MKNRSRLTPYRRPSIWEEPRFGLMSLPKANRASQMNIQEAYAIPPTHFALALFALGRPILRFGRPYSEYSGPGGTSNPSRCQNSCFCQGNHSFSKYKVVRYGKTFNFLFGHKLESQFSMVFHRFFIGFIGFHWFLGGRKTTQKT